MFVLEFHVLHPLIVDKSSTFSLVQVTNFCKAESSRGHLVDKATGKPWVVPKTGTACIEITYECALPSSTDVGNDEGVDSVINAMQEAKTQNLKELIFDQGVNSQDFYLTSDQAQMLYDEISATAKDKLESLADILPQMVNVDNCLHFLDANLDG